MAEVIEPTFSGRITDALLWVKIAAMAITDPDKAESEFNKYTDGIKKVIARKRKGRYTPSIRMGDIWFKIR